MPDPRTATPTRARRSKAGAYVSSPELARRIKAARERAGLTQAEAGRRLGIGQRTYAERELSTTLPYSALLEMIAVLGYDPAILCPELVGGSSRLTPSRDGG